MGHGANHREPLIRLWGKLQKLICQGSIQRLADMQSVTY